MNAAAKFKNSYAQFARIGGALFALGLFVFLAVATIAGYSLYQIVNPPRSPANVDVSLLMGHPTTYKFDIPGAGSREGWFFPGLLHAPTIILCHGYGSQRADVLTLTTALQEHQFNVFLFDFTGHGAIPGRTDLGFSETQQLLAAIRGLAQREDIDRTRFGVWGTDLGAYAALSAAAIDARIEAVAADSIYDEPSDFMLIQLGHTGLGGLPLVKTFSLFGFHMMTRDERNVPPVLGAVSRLQGIPKLFITAGNRPDLDGATLRIFQAAPPPKDHVDNPMSYGEMSDEARRAYEDRIVTFFLSSLPPAGQSPQ